MSDKEEIYYTIENNESDWTDWTDESLIEYEQRLFDDEMDGSDNWHIRESVIAEIKRRIYGAQNDRRKT